MWLLNASDGARPVPGSSQKTLKRSSNIPTRRVLEAFVREPSVDRLRGLSLLPGRALTFASASASAATSSSRMCPRTAYIVKVTTPKSGAVIVHSFAAGKQALLAGKQIQYVGAVGPITFDRWRNSPGQFEIVKANTALTPIATYTAQQVQAAR